MKMMFELQRYYSDPFVLNKMTYYARNREVAFLSKSRKFSNVRFMRAGYSVNWKSLFSETRFFQKDYSIYMSTSFYNYYPFFSFGSKRAEQLNKWKISQFEYLQGQDFLLDIDLNCISPIDKTIKTISDKVGGFFSNKKILTPHQIRFSGRGLHVLVPFFFFSKLGLNLNPKEENNLYDFYKNLAIDIKHHLDIPEIDSDVNTYGRLIKVPYSLANYDGNLRKVEILESCIHTKGDCNNLINAVKGG